MHLFADLLNPPVQAIVRSVPAPSPVPTATFTNANTPKRTSPWRTIGKTLLQNATSDPAQAIVQAGLNWSVERVDLRCADTLDPVPDFAAIRRSDTSALLGVVDPDYTPLQNSQMFGFFTDLANAGPDGKEVPFPIETAGSFQGGKTVWALAHLPDLGIRLGDDEAKTYLLISNGHTGNKLLTVAPTTIRVICQNTLTMAEAQAKENRRRPGLSGGFTVRHTPGMLEAIDEIREAYVATLANHKATKGAWKHLAGVPLTKSLEDRFKTTVFGKAGPDESDRAQTIRKNRDERLAAILASPTSQVRGTKDTAFSLLHAVVEWVDHDRSTRAGEGGNATEQRLASSTYGSGADLKARAWDAILELTA